MKHRIDENGYLIGRNYTDDFLQDNTELVADWILTDIPLTENFLISKLVNGAWVEGATPEQLEAYNVALCPQIITRRQLRKQLVIDGFDLAVIESMITDPLTLIDWQDSTIFERQNENVILIGMALQIDLNQFFTNASLL